MKNISATMKSECSSWDYKKLIIVTSSFLAGCSMIDCGEEVTSIKPSPNEDFSIISVSRNCGATAVPLMTVYVAPTDINLDLETPRIPKKYAAFSYERRTFNPKWMSDNSITVEYDLTPYLGRSGSFIKKRDKVGKVRITYVDIAP